MIQEITTKEQAVKLFFLGYFGNRVRQWHSLEELMADSFDKHIVIRQRLRGYGGRGITIYDIPKTNVPFEVEKLKRAGTSTSSMYFNEAIVPRNVIFQGEIQRGVGGLYLFYSTYPHHMHVALARRPQHAVGLKVKLLMEYYVCERGLDCIRALLERFENHVVEFTTCSEVFGDLSWRTIIWECRKF